MSYHIELDEYSDEALAREVERRAALAAEGRCTYCGKPGSSDPCKMRDHHDKAKKIWSKKMSGV